MTVATRQILLSKSPFRVNFVVSIVELLFRLFKAMLTPTLFYVEEVYVYGEKKNLIIGVRFSCLVDVTEKEARQF